MTTEGIVATVSQSTMTEAEEDTRLFRQKLQKVPQEKKQEPQTTHNFPQETGLGGY